jgi:hypothetical protein
LKFKPHGIDTEEIDINSHMFNVDHSKLRENIIANQEEEESEREIQNESDSDSDMDVDQPPKIVSYKDIHLIDKKRQIL